MSDYVSYRSLLFVPGSNARALEKSAGLAADGVIFDLEESVAPVDGETALCAIAAALTKKRFRPPIRLVRAADLDLRPLIGAFADNRPDGIVLPKVETIADIECAAEGAAGIPLWPMIETPRAVLEINEIAAHPLVAGMILGPNDLAKDLGTLPDPARSTMMLSLQVLVLAARAHGKIAIDGVYNRFRDEDGFLTEAQQGRALGFHGKSLIHPAQISPSNNVFSPSKDDIARARRIVTTYEAAKTQGKAVANMDGEMIEKLHAQEAQKLIDLVKELAKRDGDLR